MNANIYDSKAGAPQNNVKGKTTNLYFICNDYCNQHSNKHHILSLDD